jgi:hypothetical protein
MALVAELDRLLEAKRTPASVHSKRFQHKGPSDSETPHDPFFRILRRFLTEKAEVNRLLVRTNTQFYAAARTAILWQVEVTTSEV